MGVPFPWVRRGEHSNVRVGRALSASLTSFLAYARRNPRTPAHSSSDVTTGYCTAQRPSRGPELAVSPAKPNRIRPGLPPSSGVRQPSSVEALGPATGTPFAAQVDFPVPSFSCIAVPHSHGIPSPHNAKRGPLQSFTARSFSPNLQRGAQALSPAVILPSQPRPAPPPRPRAGYASCIINRTNKNAH